MKNVVLTYMMVLSVMLTSSAAVKIPAPSKKTVHTYVLVHGAWMAPYCWEKVSRDLKKTGAHVVIVQLPGHGSDTTATYTLSLDVYRDKVIDEINKIDGPVILVGHSMAGMVISQVAEKVPAKIEKLVYVGAYLGTNGQTLLSLANTDAQALIGPSLIPSTDKLTLDVKHENIVNIFCADSSPETQALVLKEFKPEPAIPFTNAASLTDVNFGRTDKYYIHTLQDHVIGIDLQNRMVAAAGITHVYSLDSSHTPFLSMPEKLTALLIEIAK